MAIIWSTEMSKVILTAFCHFIAHYLGTIIIIPPIRFLWPFFIQNPNTHVVMPAMNQPNVVNCDREIQNIIYTTGILGQTIPKSPGLGMMSLPTREDISLYPLCKSSTPYAMNYQYQ